MLLADLKSAVAHIEAQPDDRSPDLDRHGKVHKNCFVAAFRRQNQLVRRIPMRLRIGCHGDADDWNVVASDGRIRLRGRHLGSLRADTCTFVVPIAGIRSKSSMTEISTI